MTLNHNASINIPFTHFADSGLMSVYSDMPKHKKPTTSMDIDRGKRLKSLMERVGLSQVALAKKLDNLNQSTIARYCSGSIAPSDEVLSQLCTIFHVSADYILYGKDTPFIPSDASKSAHTAKMPQQEKTSQAEEVDMTRVEKFIEGMQKQIDSLLKTNELHAQANADLYASMQKVIEENRILKNKLLEYEHQPHTHSHSQKKTVNGDLGE